MKLIVVGASGFIGNSLYRLAKEHKIKVIGTTTKKNYKELDYFDIHYDNINDILIKNKFFDGDDEIYAVITSAISNINLCYTDKELSQAVNIDGTQRLLEYFKGRNIKTLFLSSDIVFDGSQGDYKEKDCVNPLCEYGRQKVIIENFILENMPTFLIYRITKIMGDSLQYNHIHKEVHEMICKNITPKCIKGMLFCPTYVKDIAECILLGLQHDLQGLFHVANHEKISRFDFTRSILKSLGMDREPELVDQAYFKFSEPKPLDTSLNCEKFLKAVNFKFTDIETVNKIFINNLVK